MSVEVWFVRGEEACDELRNSENLASIAPCLHGYSFSCERDASFFMTGAREARHSRELSFVDKALAARIMRAAGMSAVAREVKH